MGIQGGSGPSVGLSGGATQGSSQQQAQDIELQGIKAEGVLGGLPVAERNQDFFLIFSGVGGTGPEIIDQTAYFLEYLVDSEGNIFKPSENTSALNNLLQNFEVNKPVSVIVDNASTVNATMAGEHTLTAVGVQQPILYSQTGSSAGAFTGSIFFTGDPTLGTVGNDGTLTVPDMQAFMFKNTSGVVNGIVDDYDSFVGGTPLFTSGNARSASLNDGKYFPTASNFGDLQSFTLTGLARVKNPTSTPKDLTLAILLNGGSILNYQAVEIPANSSYLTITVEILFTNFNTSIFDSGNRFQLATMGNGITSLDFDYVKFGCIGGPLAQNPDSSGNLFQSSGQNSPPFWLTGSDGSLYITASDYISTNYRNVQLSEGTASVNSIPITDQFKDYNLSKIQVPFQVGIGDRIRFLYNPQTDFHIYDVKEPQNESDGRLKLKLNTNLSQSFTETQLSNFVLHRTNKSIPRYVILNVLKQPGVDTVNNPFTGIILPQFPTENLTNNLDSILNKLKVEGILEN